MSIVIQPGSGVIFMKVGVHATESLKDIITRKQDEYSKAGKIFWGYGGQTCHPAKLVQPFAKEYAEHGKTVNLIMHEMNSKHSAEPALAKEYSEDGIDWYPVPEGIQVKGSRFGLVIGGLTEEEFDFNLRQALVAVGPSRGKVADDYIQYQVDKGCFEVLPEPLSGAEAAIKRIHLYAPLVEPYAVFLR